jgi:hypothetical protein
MQCVGEVEPAPMQIYGVFRRFPSLDSHVRHTEQMFDRLTERSGSTSQDPRTTHSSSRTTVSGTKTAGESTSTRRKRPLALCLRIIRIVAVETGKDVRIDSDHLLGRRRSSTEAALKSSRRRGALAGRRGFTLTMP